MPRQLRPTWGPAALCMRAARAAQEAMCTASEDKGAVAAAAAAAAAAAVHTRAAADTDSRSVREAAQVVPLDAAAAAI